MKRILLLFVSILFVCTSLYELTAQPIRKMQNKDQAVLCEAEVFESPSPRIIIKWQKHDQAIRYRIQRKLLNDNFWSPDIANVDSTVLLFEDTGVELGKIYEYRIMAQCRGLIENSEQNFIAFGYVCSGVRAELPNPGKLLVLVDKTLYGSLATELEQYKEDLVKEGWYVVVREVPRAETFSKEAVSETKDIILQEAQPNMTIFLVGRVAVPYSGNLNPDAHPDHLGAWPADLYYGDPNNASWTDFSVNNTAAKRAENQNIPGDGKFDQSGIPNDIQFAVGRVDFYNMPAFTQTELQLIKNYFEKNRKYRIGLTKPKTKCVIDDNFQNLIEGFATSGWRLAPLVGKENVQAEDFVTSLEAESHLWAYGTGGGSYTSAGGIGNTSTLASKKLNGTFTILFGSYFGDWDVKDNFLRTPLATEPSILTCSWSGRPQWYYHHMGIGLPIGVSTIKTQNNQTLYQSNYLYLPAYPNGVIYSIGMRQVHQALMGDPTLRMNMGEVAEVQSMSVYQPAGQPVNISWERVFEENIGYNIYKSIEGFDGPYVRLNDGPVKTTKFVDSALFEGEVHYMVRTVNVTKTPSGSFINESRGIVKSLITTSVDILDEYSVHCYPVPAIESSNLSLSLSENTRVNIKIYDIQGNMIKFIADDVLTAGRHEFSWNLMDDEGSKIQAGVYFYKLVVNGSVTTYKFTVI